jgi:hypothetical protein
MRSRTRAIGAALACFAFLACSETAQRTDFEVPGRSPATLITPQGEAHVVYVDAGTRALMHRRLDGTQSTRITPPSDQVELGGETSPLFVSRTDGALLVIYPALVPGGTPYPWSELRAQLSRDAGRTWSAPVRVDGDTAPRGRNFADFAMAPGGDVVFSWLDSREGQQGVQTAVLRQDMQVSPAQTADPKTCECCRTALHASSSGEIWLAYRDLAEGNIRNMAYAVASGAGQPFVARGDVADDRWSVNGCPESGPRFAETADGTIWLAWFNGAANAIELAAAPRGSRFARQGAIVQNGNHPDLGVLPDGRLLVVYEAFRGGKRAIEARVSDQQRANWSAAVTIAPEGSSPRYVRNGDRALLTFTTDAGGKPHVRVVDPLPRLAPMPEKG